MSRPWMPLYIADYLADTRRLTMAEHGAYMLLIMEYWRNGGLPDDDRRLARIVGASQEEWVAVRDSVAELFLPGWKHKRIDEELARAAAKSDAAREAANLKWEKERERTSARNADALQTQCDGACEIDANSMLSQPQSQPQPLSESDSSSLRSDSASGREREFEEQFWPAYPHKVGKPDAKKSFIRARKKFELDPIMAGLTHYIAGKPSDRPWLNPSTFLNQQRWMDAPAQLATGPPTRGGGMAKLHAQLNGRPYE